MWKRKYESKRKRFSQRKQNNEIASILNERNVKWGEAKKMTKNKKKWQNLYMFYNEIHPIPIGRKVFD